MVIMTTSILLCWLIVNHSRDLFKIINNHLESWWSWSPWSPASYWLCWLIVNHSRDLFMGKGRLNTLHTYNLFASLSIVVNHQSLLSSLSLSYSLSSAASYIVIIPNQSEIYILCPITLSDFNWRRENILEYSTTTNLFCKDLFLKMYFLYFA